MSRMYLCSNHQDDEQCNGCLHGMKPHAPDECTKLEYCQFVDKKVKCKPMSKKMMKQYNLMLGAINA